MVLVAGRPSDVGAPPAPPPSGHGGGRRRRRESRSPGSSPRSSWDGSPSRGDAPRLLGHAVAERGGCSTGAQVGLAGVAIPGSKEATDPPPSPCDAPLSKEDIEDLAATIIIPSAGVGGIVLGNPEVEVARLFSDGHTSQFRCGSSGPYGPAQDASKASLLGSTSTSPMHHVPLDDPDLAFFPFLY